MSKEYERLKFSIERYDHYYDSINNKLNVYLGLSTFIVSGLIAIYPTLLEKVTCGLVTHLLMITLLSIGLANMIMVIVTSNPYLKGKTGSLLFFADVVAIPENQFSHLSENETDQQALEDMRGQMYRLAEGLNKKFRRLRIAGRLMMIQFLLFVPLVILIIKNIK